jgi:CubicO group peptidase (beta-lactamase class C family)
MTRVAILLVFGVISLTSPHALAAPADSKDAQVDRLFQQWDKPDSPGCAVAVMHGGQIVYERGYGMADLAHDAKITPTTVFWLASMSKQFTATAILMLAQQGKISLDDQIQKYVPEVPNFGTPITLRQLLHHTSGLRDQWELLTFDGWRLDNYDGVHIGTDLVTEDDVLYLVSHQKDLNFAPNTDFIYCNMGYTLLGRVVAKVSGTSLRQFTTSNLFEPLGMNQTHFRDHNSEVVKNMAAAYEKTDRGYESSTPNFEVVGATALLSTVEDLARWDENFYQPRVAGQQVMDALQERGKLNDGTTLHYAAGLYLYDYRGLKVVDHSGYDNGFITDLMRFPDQHFSVATLCNTDSIDPSAMNEKIADIYLALELAPVPTTPRTYSPGAAELQLLVGTYVAKQPRDNFVSVQLKDGTLWGLSFVGHSFKLVPVGPNHFTAFDGDADLVFDSEGSSLTWKVRNSTIGYDSTVRFERVADVAPTADQLRKYAGTYQSPELDVPYFVTVEKDRLVVHPPKLGVAYMAPVAHDLFHGGWLGWCLKFTRDANGRVSGFLLNSSRTFNLRFTRVSG